MIFTNDPIKICRIGAHALSKELQSCAVVLDPDKKDEYTLDIISFMRWLDEVEKFLYKDN